MPHYIRHQGRKQGPLSESQLAVLLSRGTVTKNTETTFDEVVWKPLGDFPEYERLLARRSPVASPPPTETMVHAVNVHPVSAPPPTTTDSSVYGVQAPLRVKSRVLPPLSISDTPSTTKAVPLSSFEMPFEPKQPKPSRSHLASGGLAATAIVAALAVVAFLVVRQSADRQAANESLPAVAIPEPIFEPIPEPIIPPEPVFASMPEPLILPEPVSSSMPAPGRVPFVELAALVSPLASVVKINPLVRDALDQSAEHSALVEEFAVLYSVRDRLLLKYVSYVPGHVFSFKNGDPCDITVSYEGRDIARLTLNEYGLKWQWLESPTPDSYQTLNGALLAELEMCETTTQQILKTFSLFTPIRKADTYRIGDKQVALHNVDVDWEALSIRKESLKIVDLQSCYKTTDPRNPIDANTLRCHFVKGLVYMVDVRMTPQTPEKTSKDLWRIPILDEMELLLPEKAADVDNVLSFVNKHSNAPRINFAKRNAITQSEANALDAAFQTIRMERLSRSTREDAADRKKNIAEIRARITKPISEPVYFEIVLVHPLNANKTIRLVEVGNKN